MTPATCRTCGSPIEPGAQVCAACGAGLLAAPAGARNRGCGLALAGGILGVVVGSLAGFTFILGLDCSTSVGRSVPHAALFGLSAVIVLAALVVAIRTIVRRPFLAWALLAGAVVFLFPFASCAALIFGVNGVQRC